MFDDVIGEIVLVVPDCHFNQLVEVKRFELEAVKECRQFFVQWKGEEDNLKAEHDQSLIEDVIIDEQVKASVSFHFRPDDAFQQPVVKSLSVLETFLSILHHLGAENFFHSIQSIAKRVQDGGWARLEENFSQWACWSTLSVVQRLKLLDVLLVAWNRWKFIAWRMREVDATQRRLRHQSWWRHLAVQAFGHTSRSNCQGFSEIFRANLRVRQENSLVELSTAQDVSLVKIVQLLKVDVEVVNGNHRLWITLKASVTEQSTNHLIPLRVLHFHSIFKWWTIAKLLDDVDGRRLCVVPRWWEEASWKSSEWLIN